MSTLKSKFAAAAAVMLVSAASFGPALAAPAPAPPPASAAVDAAAVNAWRDMKLNVRSIAANKPVKVAVSNVPAGAKMVTLHRLVGKKWVKMRSFAVKRGKATVVVPGKFVTSATRTFQVTAGKHRAAFSLDSDVGATRLTAVPSVVPSVTAVAYSNYAQVSWGSAARATAYLVEISADGGATYTLAGATTAAVRTLKVSGLTQGTSYIARVSASNDDGTGPAGFVTFTAQANPPAGVTGLVATPLDSQVKLDWANTPRATSYTVDRTCISNPGFSSSVCPVDTRTTATSAFTWGSLKNGTEYLFRVAGVNQDGTGPYATTAATPQAAPAPVTNVVATPGNGAVFARWTPSPAALEYRIIASPMPVTKWQYSAWTERNSAYLTGLENGTAYKVIVQARNKFGMTNSSQQSNITPSAAAPAAIENLQARPGDTQVTLTWDVDPSASSYVVMHREVGAENFVAAPAVSAPSAATATRTVSGLVNGTTYEFEVYATNASGRSIPALVDATPSFNASYKGLPAPRGAVGKSGSTVMARMAAAASVSTASLPAPATVTATPYSARATVTWTGVTGATGYTVSYSTNSNGPWTTFTNAAATARSASVTGLANNTAYYFQVTTVGGGSTVAGPVTPIAVPGPVTNLAGWASNGSIVTTWTGVSTATQYRVLYRPTTSTTWSPAVYVNSPATSYTIPNLVNGTSYYVQVTPVNSSGLGTASQVGPTTPSASVPAQVANIVATPASGQVTLEWPSVPGADGYQVFTNGVVGLSSTPPATVTAGEESYVITGLTNGTPYTFTIVAYNDYGVSVPSVVGPVTPGASAPAAPTSLVATAGDGQASIAFTPGASPDSPIVNYVYSINNGPLTPVSPVTASSPVVITGLTNGTTYSIELAAVNAAGQTGATSAAVSVTPVAANMPAPTNLVATPSSGAASIAFSQTLPSGLSVTNYSYSVDGGNTWTALSPAQTASPVTITGLTNGTAYSIQLQAAASNGTTSPASEAVTVTPASVPAAPTNLAASGGNGSATLTFTPPANGGAPITNYAYSLNGGALTPLSPPDASSPITITGLTNGTTYTITLAAINAVGTGPASSSVSVTPNAAPATPTGLVVTPGNSSAVATWDAAANATSYNVWLTCGILQGESAPQSGVGCPQISWPTTNTTFNINSGTSAGLVNGTTYAVAVQSVNAAGTSAKSAWVNVTPGTTPAAPADVVGSGVDGAAVIAFTPGANNGAAITNYAYSTDAGSTWTPLSPAQSTSPITISGLTNGTAYTIEIAAINSFGQGTASSSVTVTPASNPSAPTDLVATAGDGEVSIAFTAGDDGGSAITNYEYSTDGGSTWTAFSPAVTASPVTITGLTNGTTYQVALQAVTGAGTSSPSEVIVVTPLTTPSAPTGLTATAGDGQISIAFTPGADGGSAITNYAYSLNGGAFTPLPVPDVTSPIVLAGLTNGTSYSIELAAINAAGQGAASSAASATPFGAPTAPSNLTATAGNGSVSVAFTAAGSNGSAVTNYMISTNGGDTWSALSPAATTSPIVFSSLTNGTEYSLGIAAVNAAGMGAPAFVTATPVTTPDAPVVDAVTPGNGQVSVEFTAGSDGGLSVTNYQYTVNGGNTWTALSPAQTTSPITITGLTNGTTYQVALKTITAAGTSQASNTSAEFTPFTTPSAPTNLVATAGDGSASIAFTASTSGGYPIANYVYTLDGGSTQTAASPSTTTSPVTVTDLTNGTEYSVQLAALDSQGNQGPWSSAVSVTPAGAVTVPDAPTNVVGTPATSTTADVTWDAPSVDGGSELTSYAVTVSPSAGVSVTMGTFPDTTATLSGLAAGQSYTVSVTAANVAGDSAAATSAAFNTGTLTPTGLAAAVSDNAVQLTWNATTGAGSYLVYECAVVAPATSCNPVADDTTPTSTTASPYTYTLNWSTTYNFAVAAVADSITGPASASVAATIGDIPAPDEPAISTWYPQSTNGGTGGTTVAWSAVDYAEYYTCNGTNIGTATTCSLTANPDTQISYSIEACNSSGCSTAATQNTATNPNGSTQAAPTWVYNTQPGGSGSDRCVTVSWSGFASSNQYVFNANGGVPSDQQSPITGTSYEWCGASPTEAYTFTVQGVNQLTPWPPATWDTMYYGNTTPNSTTMPVVPAVPTSGPTATPGNGVDLSTSADYGTVNVTWPAVPGATSYILWRTDAVAPWYLSGTSYQDTGLAWNDSYTYELSVCNAVGCSAYGPGTTVTTAPAPALFSISTIGAGQTSTYPGTLYINVAAMPSGANAYQIFACDSSINPGCNPYTSGTGFGWITTTGFLQTPISGLNSGDSYNIGVLTAQGSSGSGLNTQAVVQSTTSP